MTFFCFVFLPENFLCGGDFFQCPRRNRFSFKTEISPILQQFPCGIGIGRRISTENQISKVGKRKFFPLQQFQIFLEIGNGNFRQGQLRRTAMQYKINIFFPHIFRIAGAHFQCNLAIGKRNDFCRGRMVNNNSSILQHDHFSFFRTERKNSFMIEEHSHSRIPRFTST